MTRLTLVVCGLGRCGSSLAMQMLAAGGMPCLGRPPAFEDTRTIGAIDAAWFETTAGQAVKVLDPHRNLIPRGADVAAVWLDRDLEEQAKSQVKFLRLVAEVEVDPRACRRFAAMNRRWYPQARAAVERWLVATLSFEDLLSDPVRAALALNRAAGGGLDEAAMAAVVLLRSPRCAPDLAVEASLLERAIRRVGNTQPEPEGREKAHA